MLKGSRLLMASISCVLILALVSGQGCCIFNVAPLADAGPDQEVDAGSQVGLNAGGSSDVNGDALSYSWQKIRGPDAVLNNPNSISPWFVPSLEGEYEFTVTVSDECGLSDTDTVRVKVNIPPPPTCPLARARTDREQMCGGQSGNLNGSESVDQSGKSLTYFWTQTGGLSVVDIDNPYIADTTFLAPEVAEEVVLTFELTVSNGDCSDTDTVVITVVCCGGDCCPQPVADAGEDQTVNENTTVTLDGSGSYDPQGEPLTFSWTQVGTPAVALSSTTAAKPTFTAPDVGPQGAVLVFQLTVSKECGDGTTLTATDEVTITVVETPPDDLDNDGILNANDSCPNTPVGEAPDANGCSCSQKDTDGDEVNDCNDQCPGTPAGQAVDANGCPASEEDIDNDGVKDNIDQCPNTPAGEAPDANGCSCSQKDGDSDGVNDCADQCPDTPVGTPVDSAGCSVECPNAETVAISSSTVQIGDSFNEGNAVERPVHTVSVNRFFMDRYEVTNQQFACALNWARSQGNLITVTNGVVYKYNSGTSYPYCDTTTSDSSSRITWNGTTFGVASGKGNHPMVMVSWYGAVAYANWRSAMEGRPLCYDLSTWTCNWSSGYRLPTEAEWEKATRGGLSGKRYPWGDNEDTSKANYTGATTAVGSYPPNGYGLYDTAGNVYEWCNDWYAPDYYSTSPYDNPKGPAGPGTMASRVERGGSFFHTGNGLRCAFRNYNGPSSRIYDGGLRLVRSDGMAFIPGSAFQMGDSLSEGDASERPVHTVSVNDLLVAPYEVTNQQFADALNWAKSQGNLITVTNGVVYKYNSGTSYPYCDTTTSDSSSRITWNGTTFGVVSGKGNHPMVMVSWYGAVAYANWRSAMEGRPLCYDLSTWTCNWSSGYRLPTEAEWEKATRGGLSGKRYPWGDNEDTSKANYTGATTAVGSYPPNGYGLYDTAGNVYEFCNDWYAPDYYSTSPYDNPKGPAGPGTMASRVERGGSFFHTGNGLRCAFRNYNGPSSRIYDGGLRLILDAY